MRAHKWEELSAYHSTWICNQCKTKWLGNRLPNRTMTIGLGIKEMDGMDIYYCCRPLSSAKIQFTNFHDCDQMMVRNLQNE